MVFASALIKSNSHDFTQKKKNVRVSFINRIYANSWYTQDKLFRYFNYVLSLAFFLRMDPEEIQFGKVKATFSSRKFSTLFKIQNMKIFNVF